MLIGATCTVEMIPMSYYLSMDNILWQKKKNVKMFGWHAKRYANKVKGWCLKAKVNILAKPHLYWWSLLRCLDFISQLWRKFDCSPWLRDKSGSGLGMRLQRMQTLKLQHRVFMCFIWSSTSSPNLCCPSKSWLWYNSWAAHSLGHTFGSHHLHLNTSLAFSKVCTHAILCYLLHSASLYLWAIRE